MTIDPGQRMRWPGDVHPAVTTLDPAISGGVH